MNEYAVWCGNCGWSGYSDQLRLDEDGTGTQSRCPQCTRWEYIVTRDENRQRAVMQQVWQSLGRVSELDKKYQKALRELLEELQSVVNDYCRDNDVEFTAGMGTYVFFNNLGVRDPSVGLQVILEETVPGGRGTLGSMLSSYKGGG